MQHYTWQQVLDFWFVGMNEQGYMSPEAMARWWQVDPQFDESIRKQFPELVDEIVQGVYQDWYQSAQGYLATIIGLDQFSRNLFRQNAKSFSQDLLAQEITLHMLEQRLDEALLPLQRVFVYLPLEHAEDLALQNLSVAKYIQLADSVSQDQRAQFEYFVEFAQRHQRVIAQFGRFPHRNRILGRTSTDEEIKHLEAVPMGF